VVGWYREETFTEFRRDGQLKSALSLAALHGITEATVVIKDKQERMTIPPTPVKVNAGTTNDHPLPRPAEPAGPCTSTKPSGLGIAVGFTPINGPNCSGATDRSVLSPPLSPKTPKRPGTTTGDNCSPIKKFKSDKLTKETKRKSDTDPKDLSPSVTRPTKVRKPTLECFSIGKSQAPEPEPESDPLGDDEDIQMFDDSEPAEEYEAIPESIPSGLAENDEDIQRDDTFWENLQADEWETDPETGEQRLKSVKAR
jgi:hypothetical protein